ncbi:hypothetical protein [Halioxenophilus aromaticivorans]|uniref:HTH gntR-type domain-containing protein n=1 Tax=Halioxenophilus aromaticivorans TaxID=1306992 RepID=A0AAV3U2I6_9ALTE
MDNNNEPIFTLDPPMQRASGLHFVPSENNALRLAERLELTILSHGLPPGYVFGSEQQLARCYQTTYQAVRQALRILQWRDWGRMRRGAEGGLVIHTPNPGMAGKLLALHFSALGLTAKAVEQEQRQLLAKLTEHPVAWALVDSLFAETLAHLRGKHEAPGTDNRALRIARNILRDKTPGQTALGSIDDLCERYSAGKPIVVQALRVLESLDLVIGKRGRAGGFYFSRPGSSAIVKAVYPHFCAHIHDLAPVQDIINAINQVSAQQAASGSGSLAQLTPLHARLKHCRPDQLVALQIESFRTLADLAQLPVLHTLIRCLWLFTIKKNSADEAMAALNVGLIKVSTEQILMAVQKQDADEAGRLVGHYFSEAVLLDL